MARGRSESTVPCNQRSSELFGQHNVGSIKGRKIATQLPNLREEHVMRITSNAKLQQIAPRQPGVQGPLLAVPDAVALG